MRSGRDIIDEYQNDPFASRADLTPIFVWHIYKEEGANEYATWIFNPSVTYGNVSRSFGSYYPGDEYVDWVALNGYDNDIENSKSVYELFRTEVIQMQKTYKNKPLMIAEIGTSSDAGKGYWQKSAIQFAIKSGIKGINFWSEDWYSHGHGGDTRINSSPSAFKGYKEGISDPRMLGRLF